MLATLQELLATIKAPIWLTTVCRSTRDGYTPRQLRAKIEAGILGMLAGHAQYDDDLYRGVSALE
jgi:hypothetical protein